ncbi:MAG: BatA domain-containing protein [Salinivirgaceae bacterium]|jgi:hypothetical protein|nr:BatA domain-containing protein [Salinivirgaceae bacterium]
MTFQHPALLYGLTLTALPIIIHLINLRKHRKMYFSSLFFLKNTDQQTKKIRKLYQYLVLLMRMLAIASIVIAFAGPVKDTGNLTNGKSLHIVIDNTLSMEGENSKGNLFEQARTKAIEIVNTLSDNSTVNLHTLAGSTIGKDLTKEKSRQIISELEPEHGLSKLNRIFAKNREQLSSSHYYILSDFQKNIIEADTILQDSNLSVSLIPLENTANNISIDSIWFSSPVQWLNSPITANIEIQNHGNDHIQDLAVTTKVNGQLNTAGTIDIKPKSSAVFQSSLDLNQTGTLRIIVEIDDMPITFDNTYHTGLYIYSEINILEIGEKPSRYISTLFNDSAFINHAFAKANNVTPTALSRADAIIIHEPSNLSGGIISSVQEQMKQGCNIIVIPNDEENINDLNSTLDQMGMPTFTERTADTTKITQADINHHLLANALDAYSEDMNLPSINQSLKTENANTWNTVLFNDMNQPMLLHKNTFNGNTYLFCFDALHQNFALNPIFIPIMYNAVTIRSKSIIPQITCAQATSIDVVYNQTQEEKPPVISGKDAQFIPYGYHQQNRYIIAIREHQITNKGFYRLENDTSLIATIAANHNTQESVLAYYSATELQERYFNRGTTQLFDASEDASSILNPVKHFWKHFIALTLLWLIIEMLLLRKIRFASAKAQKTTAKIQ